MDYYPSASSCPSSADNEMPCDPSELLSMKHCASMCTPCHEVCCEERESVCVRACARVYVRTYTTVAHYLNVSVICRGWSDWGVPAARLPLACILLNAHIYAAESAVPGLNPRNHITSCVCLLGGTQALICSVGACDPPHGVYLSTPTLPHIRAWLLSCHCSYCLLIYSCTFKALFPLS